MIQKLLSLLFGGKKEEETASSTQQHQATASKPAPQVEEEEEEPSESDKLRARYVKLRDGLETLEAEIGSKDSGDYDQTTLHGTHYDVAIYEKWLDEGYNYGVDDALADNPDIDDDNRNNIYDNWMIRVFTTLNPSAGDDRLVGFQQKNSKVSASYTGGKNIDVYNQGDAKSDPNDPNYAPIHGLSIEDYGAVSARMASGLSGADIAAAFSISESDLNDAVAKWTAKMQELMTAGDYSASVYMSNGYSQVDQHPILGNVKRELSAKAQQSIDKLKADDMYCQELMAWNNTACELGNYNWLKENHDLSTGELIQVNGEHSQHSAPSLLLKRQEHYEKCAIEAKAALTM